MEREVFKSNPLRGIPMGLVRGFINGCVILLSALFIGIMDEELFIPLLAVVVILGGIIGFISGIGKKIETDENGIYFKSKAYLFAENNMFMHVYTHFRTIIPLTERDIRISGKDGKRKVNCTFLSKQDAGRLAKVIEDGMKKKFSSEYDELETDNPSVQYFVIPASELTDRIDKRIRLVSKILFWFLTVLFSWILISMLIQDQLEDYGLGLLVFMATTMGILDGVNIFISRRFKKSAQNIPREILFSCGTMYIDGKAFGVVDITRVVMTPECGTGTGDMRKLVVYDTNGTTTEYCFGFRSDSGAYPGYFLLTDAVKNHFGDKFAYDMN